MLWVVAMMVHGSMMHWAAEASGSVCARPEDFKGEQKLGDTECRLHGVKESWSADEAGNIETACLAFGGDTKWNFGECKLDRNLEDEKRAEFDPWCTGLGGEVALWDCNHIQDIYRQQNLHLMRKCLKTLI